MGLVSYSLQPAFMARSLSAAIACAVNAIIGISAMAGSSFALCV